MIITMTMTMTGAMLLVVAAMLLRRSNGFVNVPQVRKPELQSTSTSVTWEPMDVLTDAFQRNPFAGEKDIESDSTNSNNEPDICYSDGSIATQHLPPNPPAEKSWFSQVLSSHRRQPTSLLVKYIQSEQARRKLRDQCKVALHNFLRDSGLLRSIVDFLVTIGTPAMAKENPEIVPRFLQLTRDCIQIPYGDGHQRQSIDFFLPSSLAR